MKLKESSILEVTLRILFPFIVLFSFQLFSYGAHSPGGGFQAGVVLGTMVVILELLWDRRIYENGLYRGMEIAGLILLFGFAAAGWIQTGMPFGGFYAWQGPGLLFSNVYLWGLNLAIFLEVAGSMVLLFRYFIGWHDEAASI
ncbi:MAG: MnhB domain-containing protein [Kiritimatiellia bacterium]|nr:MnhB domain-containing protein [Kiritimatiellia bacterium]